MTHNHPAPKSTDSNLDHALLYHSMGWWVFPGRSPLDVAQDVRRYVDQGMAPEAAYKRAHAGRKHTFVRWANCPKSCTFTRTADAPACPKHERRKMGEAGRPTEAEIRDWFEHEPRRPVIILTGPGATAGGQLVGVDVDVLKGGEAAPWIGEEVTMLAGTPNSGYHAYHITDDAEIIKTVQNDPAPGIDIRGEGGLLVAPSGDAATPGREWLRWGALSPAPLVAIRAKSATRGGQVKARLARVAEDPDLDPDVIPDAPPAGPFVLACSEIAPPTERQNPIRVLVSMLARRSPLPPDAVDAALDLLIEARGDDDPEVVDGWREALEADSRSSSFARKVTHAWNKMRVSPPWSATEIETTTGSWWNYAAQMESAHRLQTEPPAPPEVAEPAEQVEEEQPAEPAAESEPPSGGVFEPPPPLTAAQKKAARTPEQIEEDDAQTRADVDSFAPTLGDAFNLDAFGAVLSRVMIPSGVLPPWREVLADGSVVPVTNTPSGHGFGEAMDDIIGGGLKPGFMAVVGAEAAKVGKTAIMDQWMDGILLRSVEVLRALEAGEKTDEAIIVRYDLSEMNAEDLTMRQLGRWIGIDSTAFRRGRNGHKAPGVKALAAMTGEAAESIFARYKAAAESEIKTGDLAKIRKLRRIIDPRSLYGRHDKGKDADGRDNRRGVLLLQAVANAIKLDVEMRAKQWGVPEKQIVPLIFIDPIQRFQSTERGDAVGALDELVEELRAIADEIGAIVFATSDTNKESAKAPSVKPTGPAPTPAQIAAGVFRGSYKLLHLPDVAFVLRSVANNPRQMELLVGINRWNGQTEPVRLDFDRQTGRYTPAAPETATPPVARPPAPAGVDPAEDEDGIPEPPETEAKPMMSADQQIWFDMLQAGATPTEIGRQVGKPPSTITRGLTRVAEAQGLIHWDQLRKATHVE